MRRKRSSILDLDMDALRHIMVCLGRYENGYADLARATSVCKVFKEIAGDKEILRSVIFETLFPPQACESFWHMDGLLSKCTRAGSHTAYRVLLEDYAEKMGAVACGGCMHKGQIKSCCIGMGGSVA